MAVRIHGEDGRPIVLAESQVAALIDLALDLDEKLSPIERTTDRKSKAGGRDKKANPTRPRARSAKRATEQS